MNPVTSVFILLGALVALLAGIGLLTFNTPYARFHAAGQGEPDRVLARRDRRGHRGRACAVLPNWRSSRSPCC